MVLRRRRRQWYFCHAPGQKRHLPESADHLAGKAALTAWLAAGGLAPENERVILAGEQRIDVCVPDLLLAGEYQCSPLTLGELTRRHDSYREAAWRDWWVLGERYGPTGRWPGQTAQFCQYSPALGFYVYVLRKPFTELELWHHLARAPHMAQWLAGGVDRFPLAQDWAVFQRWHNRVRPAPVLPGISVPAWRDRLAWQSQRRDPRVQRLVQQLYRQGKQLTAIPAWCFPTRPLPPVFAGSFFNWAIQTWLGVAVPPVPQLAAPLFTPAEQKKWAGFPARWLAQQHQL
ncbi:hypothetical protein L248_1251 [Schleiferilactobacillus shenzhenensis LY-73]|uniref:Competence protein CoiA nuclease-like domain-containing protein n=1 Tax=Schleiferilactobacillus shenzhenensis LY-73 TaxID=1231336 RepID=U4TPJ1_9LACO|nr:hypothetical protein L248_1251 [Schleiferilactobacillus shenzhenensis LY-73]